MKKNIILVIVLLFMLGCTKTTSKYTKTAAKLSSKKPHGSHEVPDMKPQKKQLFSTIKKLKNTVKHPFKIAGGNVKPTKMEILDYYNKGPKKSVIKLTYTDFSIKEVPGEKGEFENKDWNQYVKSFKDPAYDDFGATTFPFVVNIGNVKGFGEEIGYQTIGGRKNKIGGIVVFDKDNTEFIISTDSKKVKDLVSIAKNLVDK